jgi:threonine dehydrogenase-like Zn-dependent dehydrogenase
MKAVVYDDARRVEVQEVADARIEEPGDDREDDSLLRGAGEVYVVDRVPERLDKAGELGATPIDFTQGDPVEQIRLLRHRRLANVPPWGAGIMDGVMCAIDAVGFQALDRVDPARERPTQVVEDIVRLVNPTGRVGIAGVYAERDLAPAPQGSADGSLRIHWASLFNKGVSLHFGRTHDRRYTTGCGTWSWPAAPVPAASSPTMAVWRTRLACTSASTSVPTG